MTIETIDATDKPQPLCAACNHSKSDHDRDIGCTLSCACSEFRVSGKNPKSKSQPKPKNPATTKKSFFKGPLSKGARHRLARELGSMGMSKQAVTARINQIVEWQTKSPKEKEKAVKAKHLFVQGGLPSLGRRN